MKRTGKKLALALSAIALGTSVRAVTQDSPYRGIVERNIFNVHPAPPAPVVNPLPPMPPPPNIRLQGITEIFGRKQVLFKVQLPPKGGTPAKEESFILTVGERQGDIEVLDINPKLGTVKMRNYGVETNLSLDLNSDKLVNVAPSTTPIAAATPAQMTAPGALAPPPPLPAGKFPRTLRLPGAATAQPSSPFGGGYNSANQTQQISQATPEEQMVSVEAQRIIYQKAGNPLAETLPPLPPAISRALGVDQPKPDQAPQ